MSLRFRFGVFELDADTLDLRRDGTIVHLQAQPKQVLECLVRNADRTVSREELRRSVWGDQTFVDFERGLNFCISQIRSTLADDAARPRYIRTFARQGYQFIAPVEKIESPAGGPPFRLPLAQGGGRKWLAALAVVCLIAGGIGLVYVEKGPTAAVPIVAVMRFDNETGNPGMSRFSDDLTDNFVERLTSLSNGHYAVIGNAQVLRLPRDQRDLRTVATNLRANFVILGQVQAYGDQTRILVHLIRMPEQTHVTVARLDRSLTNALELEAEVAQEVADKFSRRLAANTPGVSPALATR
jgi:DNA-binding winged helix-turn-helix (wHTH) protein/TolB-like protein